MNAKNPLDASAVHPESYPVVEKIAKQYERDIKSLIGDSALLTAVNAEQFVDDKTGVITVKDILNELQKPGRDPRPEFTFAEFKEGVNDIKDLKPNRSEERRVGKECR